MPAASITVVVPNYNHERYLKRCLDSVAGQRRAADAVIVVDDASTDGSVTLLETYLADRPGWRLLRHAENRGVAQTLNDGLAAVETDWALFLGADDEIVDGALQALAGAVEADDGATRIGFVSGQVEVASTEGWCKSRPPILPSHAQRRLAPEDFQALLRKADNFFPGTTTLYNVAALRALGGFDPRLGSLCDGFVLRRIAVRNGFAYIPRILGRWWMQDGNYSTRSMLDTDRFLSYVDRAFETLAAEPSGLYPANYAALLRRRLMFGALTTLLQLSHTKEGAARAEQARILSAEWRRLLPGTPSWVSALVRLLVRLGSPGRRAVLALAFAQCRPADPLALLLEPVRSRLARRR